MALDDFQVLIKAYWKAALIGPIVAIALCVALAFSNGATANYSATSAITVVDPANRGGSSSLLAMAESYAKQNAALLPDATCSATIDSTTTPARLVVTASGPDEANVIEASNIVVDSTISDLHAFMEEYDVKYNRQIDEDREALEAAALDKAQGENGGNVLLSLGVQAKSPLSLYELVATPPVLAKASSFNLKKTCFAALLIGFAASAILLGGIYVVRGPILNSRRLTELTGIEPLADGLLKDDNLEGIRMASANLLLRIRDRYSAVRVIPVSDKTLAKDSCVLHQIKDVIFALSKNAHACDSIELYLSKPIPTDVSSLFDIQDHNAVVICARVKSDSEKEFVLLEEELRAANANVVGLMLLA